MGEFASPEHTQASSYSAPIRRPQVEVAHDPRTAASDAIRVGAREVSSVEHSIEAVRRATAANDVDAWKETRANLDHQLAHAEQVMKNALAHARDASPEDQAVLATAERGLADARTSTATLEAPQGWRPVARETEILGVLKQPITGPAKVGYEQKEQALRAELSQLSPTESALLAERIRKARPGDPIAAEVSRLIPERRARIQSFLADARRRAAVTRATSLSAASAPIAASAPASMASSMEGPSCEVEKVPDPFAPKLPAVSRAAPTGRLGETWPVTIPEQVVGSSHQFEIGEVRNLNAAGATCVMSIAGSPDLRVDAGIPIHVSGTEHRTLRATYAPTTAGPQHSVVTLVVRWDDGHVEQREIHVEARARTLDEAPASASTAARAPKPPGHKIQDAPKAPDRVVTVDTDSAWKTVSSAFDGMMDEQGRGVDLVEKESAKFKPQPAERSLWQDLADIAFQLGTGAVAGLVARFVSTRVASAIVGAEHDAARAAAGAAEIASAQKAASAAAGDVAEEYDASRRVIAAKVGNYATSDAARHAKFAQGEISSSVAMSVSTAITRSAAEIRGPQDSGGSATGTKPASPQDDAGSAGSTSAPASLDEGIAFFSDQSSMIGQLHTDGSARLNDLLAEQIKLHPDIAPDLMHGVQQGLAEVRGSAKKIQAEKTSAEFMTYLARTNLGTEKITTTSGSQAVTNMQEQRGHGDSLLEPSALATGVLEISCDYRGGEVRVTDARTRNVSWLIANRLIDVKLAGTGVPMRLSLYGGGTILTRDEAGRVRVSGTLGLSAPFSEAQDIAEAERIFAAVLAKSLGEWGIVRIHTNDATQGPDPKKENTKK